MKRSVENILKSAVESSIKKGLLTLDVLPSFTLSLPDRREHGDFATNVAMMLASQVKMAPRKIAEIIKEECHDPDGILDKIEIAGPGFINLFVKQGYWYPLLKEVIVEEKDYGKIDIGKGERVQIEFVSANPTGPLHVGHGRGAATGDALARILRFAGFDVVSEYYINDVGVQMTMLGRSVYARYRELLGETSDFPENGYKGDYIREIADKVLREEGRRLSEVPEDEAISFLLSYAEREILGIIREDLEGFGVHFDVWYSEKNLIKDGKLSRTIDAYDKKGLIYEKDGAKWFKTMEFGDDKDRVVVKADGITTYFASDIVYHKEKYDRGFERVIDIWGADHHGYEPRIKAFLKAIGKDDALLDVLFVQLVALLRGGEKVSMSTRAGEFVTLKEVVDEVGADAARFFFLLRRSDSQFDFDLDLAKKQTPENPVFYVQYAHARISSIMALAEENEVVLPGCEEVNFKLLDLEEEIGMIKALSTFPELVKGMALSLEPHRLTFYLQELASSFHSYYNRNRVISGDEELTHARLYLCRALRTVIRNGLNLLGVSAPLKM